MQKFADKYHARMSNSYRAFFELLQANKEVIPVLQRAVEDQIAKEGEADQVLRQLQNDLSKMDRVLERIKDATSQIGGGVGHLMEEQYTMDETVQDLAQLTTVAQLPAIALKADSKTISEVLENVDMPAFEEAVQEVSHDRLIFMLGAIERVVGKKRA